MTTKKRIGCFFLAIGIVAFAIWFYPFFFRITDPYLNNKEWVNDHIFIVFACAYPVIGVLLISMVSCAIIPFSLMYSAFSGREWGEKKKIPKIDKPVVRPSKIIPIKRD